MSEGSDRDESTVEAPPSGLERYLPPVEWLRGYEPARLGSDAVAGLLVAVLLVPQAMAYAMLAGLPPRTGLYAAMAPPILYAILGTSRFLSVGPVALVSLLVADAVGRAPGVEGDSGRLAAALVLATLVGVILILLGLLRLGFVANFLSGPVLTGFTAGAAVLIAASQLGSFLGLDLERSGNLFDTLREVARQIEQSNPATAILGGVCLATLLVGGKPLEGWLEKTSLPSRARSAIRYSVPLLVTLGALAAVRVLSLSEEYGVATVGELGAGLPSPAWPPFGATDWRPLLSSAFGLGLVAFVIAVAIAKSLASRRGQRIEPSQEMIALGAANVAAGFTGACPVGGSVSRSALAFQAGAGSPVAQVIVVGAVLGATLTLGSLLADLPEAALAAIILSAVVGMVDVDAMNRVFKISRFEALTLGATLLSVVALGVQAGIAVGAASALALYLWRTSRPRIVVEGIDEETGQFQGENGEDVESLEAGVLVLRIDESLYFANSRHCEDQILEEVADREQVERLVLDLSAMGEIDATALEMLERLVSDLEEAGVDVALAHLRQPVRERMERAGLVERIGEDRVFDSTHDAVSRNID